MNIPAWDTIQSRWSAMASSGSSQLRSRAAYTLLEVLLSIGLVAILSTALSLASHSFLRFQQKAKAAQERTASLRCMLNDLTQDLRGVPEMLSDVDLKGNERFAESEILGRESVLQWESNGGLTLVPFFGTADAIFFSTQSRNGYLDREAWLVSLTSKVNGVAWMAGASDTVRMPLVIGNGGVNDLVFHSQQERTGVCRYRVTPTQTQLNGEHEDVRYLRFRYWDGRNWCSSWDSIELNALPRAIEVTVATRGDEKTPMRAVISLTNSKGL
jgi:type II secretory pathway pseudopilin PulG